MVLNPAQGQNCWSGPSERIMEAIQSSCQGCPAKYGTKRSHGYVWSPANGHGNGLTNGNGHAAANDATAYDVTAYDAAAHDATAHDAATNDVAAHDATANAAAHDAATNAIANASLPSGATAHAGIPPAVANARLSTAVVSKPAVPLNNNRSIKQTQTLKIVKIIYKPRLK